MIDRKLITHNFHSNSQELLKIRLCYVWLAERERKQTKKSKF